jgi:hypothetical protein
MVKSVTLALVATGCIAAAGFGAYFAVRHHAETTAPAARPEAVDPGAASAPKAVTETEAIVGDESSVPAAAPRAPEPQAPPVSVKPARKIAAADGRSFPAATEPAGVRNGGAHESAGQLDRRWPTPVPETQPAPPVVPVEAGAPNGVGQTIGLAPYEPPAPSYEELVVSADSVLGLQLETTVSSETARLEDPVEARVTRDVMVGGQVAVPSGTKVLGTVTLVDRGGKVKERSRLGIRFHTLVMADATNVPILTDTVYREGEPPSKESVAKIGGAAVGGAILGAILGGTKGAVVGGATGAAGGTAVVMAGGRNAATIAAGSPVTVRLISPVTITVER